MLHLAILCEGQGAIFLYNADAKIKYDRVIFPLLLCADVFVLEFGQSKFVHFSS